MSSDTPQGHWAHNAAAPRGFGLMIGDQSGFGFLLPENSVQPTHEKILFGTSQQS